jgi:hypothetical protein
MITECNPTLKPCEMRISHNPIPGFVQFLNDFYGWPV